MAPTCKQILGLILMVQVAILVVYLAATDFSFEATILGYLYSNSSNTSRQDYNNSSNTSLQDYINSSNTSRQDYNNSSNTSLQDYSNSSNTSLQDYINSSNTSLQDYSNSSNTSLQDYNNSSNTSRQDGASTKGPPPREPETFQPIDGKQAWLYSAFYDDLSAQNGKPQVRVVCIVHKEWTKEVFCNFSTENGNLAVNGTIITLPGAFSTTCFPSHVECSVPSNVRPTHVSVSFETTDKPTNRLKIIYPGPRIRNFTVCYSVLFGGYNKKSLLIESIELNRILGAEHFMVYNYSISPEVSQILSRYQDDGLVTVLQWPLPTLECFYFAQLAALNDCSYRNRNTSRFVVVVDTDELIVPRSNYTWMELIHNISPTEIDVSQFMNSSEPSNKRQTQTGCFTVRSSNFCFISKPSWELLPSQFLLGNEDRLNILKYKIQTLSQVVRDSLIYPPPGHSKYIARPEFVYVPGVHSVQIFIRSKSCLLLSETRALVHHYRIPYCSSKSVLDPSVLKFQQTLYPRVMKQIQRFPNLFL